MATEAGGTPLTQFGPILICSLIGAMGYVSFLDLPVLVGGIVDGHALPSDSAGWLASCEMAGLLAGSVAASRLIARDARMLVAVGMLLAVVANGLTAIMQPLSLLCLARLVAGTGGGLLYSVASARLAAIGDATRNFSLLNVVMIFESAILLGLMPILGSKFGLPAMLLVPIVSLLAVAPLVRWVPALPRAQAQGVARVISDANDLASTGVLRIGHVCLGAAFCFGMVLAGVWAYVERIAAASALSPVFLSATLSVSNLAGLAICWFATWLDKRVSATIPLTIALITSAAILAIWPVGHDTRLSYFALTFLNVQATGFANIHVFAVFGKTDRTGRQAALAPGVIGLGQAVGPLVSAAVAGNGAELHVALRVNAMLLVVVAAMMGWAMSRLDRQSRRERAFA